MCRGRTVDGDRTLAVVWPGANVTSGRRSAGTRHSRGPGAVPCPDGDGGGAGLGSERLRVKVAVVVPLSAGPRCNQFIERVGVSGSDPTDERHRLEAEAVVPCDRPIVAPGPL